MLNFWQKLRKPITVLAPMDGVTDTVFRQAVASRGKPSVFFTEFTSTDGLCSKGGEKLKTKLTFTEAERPIVAQIWGSDPKKFYQAAKIIQELGFDGIDINMGCPDRKVVGSGAGAALILNPELVREIIKATKQGAPALPLSVKTRLGFSVLQTEQWLGFLLGQGLAAMTVHGRTAKEKSEPSANWEEIRKVVEMRDQLGVTTLVLGNGDVKSYTGILEKFGCYRVDGIMVGRGIFENLWLFNPAVNPIKITSHDRIKGLSSHLELYQKTWGKEKKIEPLKKFVKIYIAGFSDASVIREKLMSVHSAEEMGKILQSRLQLWKS